MLLLKPNCECCDRDLPPSSPDARICTFECTFCAECSDTYFDRICPNCGGDQVQRPRRPDRLLKDNPPSDRRFVNRKAAWFGNLFPAASE